MAASKNTRFAVITGASSGIGFELARVFAQNGFDLLINAEDAGIEKTGDELRGLVQVKTVQADLAKYDEVEKLYREIQSIGRPVDALALNAGVGVGGDFTRETSLEAELNLINLNVVSTVHLAKRILPQMVERGSGRVLFTSSIAATMPTPLEAIYGASKAFIQSLANSLRFELKDTGVTVTSLMPGPTDTNFFDRAGMGDTKIGKEGKYSNDPADVARQGFEALMAGEDHVFSSSLSTKLQGESARFVPDSIKAAQHEKMAKPA